MINITSGETCLYTHMTANIRGNSMMKMTSGVLAVLLFHVQQTSGFDNTWDGLMHKECRPGYVFGGVFSIYGYRARDRRYDWHCTHRSIFRYTPGSCYWTGYLNHFDGLLDFNCQSSYALVGVQSYHHNGHEDRRFKFKCCRPSTSKRCWTEKSTTTSYVNDYRRDFTWSTDVFITGAYSVHSNHKEDRRWKFRTAVIKCGVPCSCPSVATSDWYVDDVQYKLNQAKVAANKPMVLASKIIDNTESSSKASITFKVSETKSSSYSFSHETGVDLTATMSFSVGLPYVTAELGTSLGISKKQKRTKQDTITKAFSSSFTLTVETRSMVKAEVLVQQFDIDVPYTMRLKHRTDGCMCNSAGTWRGVDFYNTHMKIVDLNVKKLQDMESGTRREVGGVNISDDCWNGTNGWNCESNGAHFYGFDAFNFPSAEVPENPKWTAKTKAECLESCHDEGDCAGVVRETDLGDDDTGNCYLITSGAVIDCKAHEDTENDKKFNVWLAHGIEQNCYDRPTTSNQ